MKKIGALLLAAMLSFGAANAVVPSKAEARFRCVPLPQLLPF